MLSVFNETSSQFIFKEIWIREVYRPQIDVKMNRVVDLGANVGLTSWFWLYHQAMPQWHLALEPDPETFSVLKRNLPELDARQQAVGPETGEWRQFETGYPDSVNRRFDAAGQGIAVNVVAFKALLAEPVDLVKMDVEGAEWAIFSDVLTQVDILEKVRYWMVEFHAAEEHVAELMKIREAFAQSGFHNLQKGDVVHFYRV